MLVNIVVFDVLGNSLEWTNWGRSIVSLGGLLRSAQSDKQVAKEEADQDGQEACTPHDQDDSQVMTNWGLVAVG